MLLNNSEKVTGKSDSSAGWFAYQRPVSNHRTEFARVTCTRRSPVTLTGPYLPFRILMKLSPSQNFSTTIISEIIFFLLLIESIYN